MKNSRINLSYHNVKNLVNFQIDEFHEIKYFLIGILFLGINNGLMNVTFNNYLDDHFKLSAAARGLLEFPRESPGFLLIFVTSVLTFLSLRYWAVLVGIFSAVGILGLGYFSPTLSIMTVWMVLWSLGDHLWMPVEAKIGLELSKGNDAGKKLGQITGIRNLAQVIGTIIVWIIMDSFKLSYNAVYVVAFFSGIIASIYFYKMRIHSVLQKENKRFVFKKKYTIFHLLNIIFGARKQIFITFAPWVLIQYFGATPKIFAILIFVASIISYFFRQELGKLVDSWGERNVFFLDSFVLLLISIAFIFSKNTIILYTAYVLDYLMFAMRIARTTYLQKIADSKDDITPTISFGITLDHIASMTVPFLGGLLWMKFGYKAVFTCTSILAMFSFVAASKVRLLRD